MQLFLLEFRRLFLSPRRLAYTLVLPLLLFGVLTSIFYKETLRDLPVAYIDFDQSQLSARLVRLLDATPSMRMAISVADEAEARQLMAQMKVYALVIIGNDFEKNVLQGKNQEVICYTNNQFILPAGLILKDFQTTIGTFSAGIGIRQKTQKGQQIQKAIAQTQSVRVDEHAFFNPYSNYAHYLLVAFLPMMLQMIVMMITIYVLGIEFKRGNGRQWLAMSGHRPMVALLGKLLPYTLVLFFVGWWMNYLLFGLIGVPLQIPMYRVVLMTWLLIVVYQTIGIVIVSFLPELRSALTIGSGFTAIAFSFAAYTFPVEGLPMSMRYLAEIFPFTHFLEYFVNRAVKGIPIIFVWKQLAVLVVYLLLGWIAFPRFVKRIEKGSYG